MCFGNRETGRETGTETYQPQGETKKLAGYVGQQTTDLLQKPFQAYGGDRVAGFDPMQEQAFNIAGQAGSSTNQYLPEQEGLVRGYANGPAQSVSADKIYAGMDPYMNKFTDMALAPQLALQNQQFQDQNRAFASNAVGAGAYGDDRAGIGRAQQNLSQDMGRSGLIGQAYQNAFNTAIGASAQDVSNSMAAQGQTGAFREQALQRALGGAGALGGLDQSQINRSQALTSLLQQQGGLKQMLEQQKLNVPYSDYLAAQQYPFLTTQLGNQSLGAISGALKGTTTKTNIKEAPDNSGWAMLGSLGGNLLGGGGGGSSMFGGGGNMFGGAGAGAGAAGAGADAGFATGAGFAGDVGTMAAMMSDVRLKEDIAEVGALHDGTPVFSFRFKGTQTPQIGLMAQDIEQRVPEAVHETPSGYKAVDYHKATALARALGAAMQ